MVDSAQMDLNGSKWDLHIPKFWYFNVFSEIWYTSSTAEGGGGSFKDRKPVGEVGCCKSPMAERTH